MSVNVLVTGCLGFLGRSLWEAFEEREEVILWGVYRSGHSDCRRQLYCDLTDIDAASWVMEFTKPDIVIHAAANPLVRVEAPCSITVDNVVATHNLLAACPAGARFVLVSSLSVLGARLDEGPVAMGDECRPVSVYGASKLAAEYYLEAHHRQGRVVGSIVRPVAMVGPRSTHGLLHDVVRKLRSHARSLELIGQAPGACKPFAYVDDVARCIVELAMEKYPSEELRPLHLGPLDHLTVMEVAEMAMRALEIYKPIQWGLPGWAGDQAVVRLREAYQHYHPRYSTSRDAVQAALEEYVVAIS